MSNSTLSVTVSSTTNITPCYGDNNGTATATATNGTPGYTYSWSNGATTSGISNLAAGGYTITVTDAAGCTATANTNITQPTQVKDTVLTSTNVSCSGDSNGVATVTASGGSGTYTYLWSNSATTSSITGLKRSELILLLQRMVMVAAIQLKPLLPSLKQSEIVLLLVQNLL